MLLNIYGYGGFGEFLGKFGTKSNLYNILVYDLKAIKQNKFIQCDFYYQVFKEHRWVFLDL